ncbi:hypothetical protein SLEP1_g5430 [Rubroshorea leprosula]|uniref:Uncharacterized protein n=1 Tax=Rubroshorea leprosula TaxID=152421 RepID=A0AAV5I2Q2_9ROSI|nr:hypothetical protein SLEP1_g5430 [Rubroshorea leprosula]
MEDHRKLRLPDSHVSEFYDYDDGVLLMGKGLYRRRYGDMGDNHHRIQEKARKMGKSLDPRLTVVFEFFRELYVRRKELLKNIFPEDHHEFGELLDKITEELFRRSRVRTSEVKVRGLRRSLSIGSPRELKGKGDEPTVKIGDDKGGEPSLRLHRFKIRTVKVGDDEGGSTGQGETKPTGSK